MPAPSLLAIQMKPCARARSTLGNHRAIAAEQFGYAPASPTPNKKRNVTRLQNPPAAPVSAVKPDHHTTIRVMTLRGPRRSPIAPVGISNRPYASTNAPRTHPHWLGVRPRSA
jgi:hypothetical protein